MRSRALYDMIAALKPAHKHCFSLLSGLLWNLSSHDLLKESLSRQALTVLTQSVLVPSSGISEGENPKDELLADEEAFHSATGCLRWVFETRYTLSFCRVF